MPTDLDDLDPDWWPFVAACVLVALILLAVGSAFVRLMNP